MMSAVHVVMLTAMCCLYMTHGADAFHRIKLLTRDIFYPEKFAPETDLEYERLEDPVVNVDDLFVTVEKKTDLPITETISDVDKISKFDYSAWFSNTDKFPSLRNKADSEPDVTNSPESHSSQFSKFYLKFISGLIQQIMDMLFLSSEPPANRGTPDFDLGASTSKNFIENDEYNRDFETINYFMKPVNIKSSDTRRLIKRDIPKVYVTANSNESSGSVSINGKGSQNTTQKEIPTNAVGSLAIDSEHTLLSMQTTSKNKIIFSTADVATSTENHTPNSSLNLQTTLNNKITNSDTDTASSTENKTLNNKITNSDTDTASSTENKTLINSSAKQQNEIAGDSTLNSITVKTESSSLETKIIKADIKNETVVPKISIKTDNKVSPEGLTSTSSKKPQDKTEVPENLLSADGLINDENIDPKTIENSQQFQLRMSDGHPDSKIAQRSPAADTESVHGSSAATVLAVSGTILAVMLLVFAASAIFNIVKKRNEQGQTGAQTSANPRTVNA